MKDDDEIDVNAGCVLIAVGLLFVLGGLIAIRTGKTPQSRRHRWGFVQSYDVEREHTPIQFWIHVALFFLVGLALVGYGVRKLLAL